MRNYQFDKTQMSHSDIAYKFKVDFKIGKNID